MPETDALAGGVGTASAVVDFEPDGDLSESTLVALHASGAAELGLALTLLVDRLATFDEMKRDVARPAIERAIAAGSQGPTAIDITSQIPRLIRLYQRLSADPARQDVAPIVLRLLATADRNAVLASIPLDAEGLELRVRLGRALDGSSGISGRAHGTRGIGDESTSVNTDEAVIESPSLASPTPAIEPESYITHAKPPEPTPPFAAAPGAPPAPVPATRETYKAYGVLACDEVVLVGRAFPLELGLGASPSAGVSGPAMPVPVPIEAYDLEVQLFADGFDVAPGESLRHTLRITNDPDGRFPTVTVHLTAREMQDHIADREISAAFVIAGEALGTAQRNVRVTTDTAEIEDRAVPVGGASGTNITAPTGDPKADLTIIIKRGLAPGSLMWSVESDIAGVRPPEPIPDTDIGDQPVRFAKNLIGQISQREHDNSIFSLVEGLGGAIADQLPTEVFDAIRVASDKVKPNRPQILILTDEPFVPWELAWLDPPLDPTLPAYLGAQANVGRWILNSKTPTDPRRAVKAEAMAVVSGVFIDQRLEAAEEEARQLGTRYQATPVDARLDPVMSLIRGAPAADILHFAVHGKYDPQGYDEGIYLVAGPPILPLQIRTGKLKDRAPFVFLNACQLGSSAELLGDYYGTAQAFLRAGASAVVAPLWSVDDEIAQQIALHFYERALAAPAGPNDQPPLVADLLREVRLGIVANADKQSATYLAYQFYGHPSLRLSWAPTN